VRQIEIIEVAPRDGLQNEPVLVSLERKLDLIRRAVEAGARRIEVTSFVNPSRVPQMADAEAVLAGVPRRPDVRYGGLVLNERGFVRAAEARCDEITFVIVASETFSQRNQGAGVAEILAHWRAVARQARAAAIPASIIIGASFGCPFEGRVPVARVLDLVQAVAEDEPAEIAFADTIGCGVPTQVTELLTRARERAPQMKLRCHFHDTRNTGIANAVAAVEAGVHALDSSIGGIGGCPFAPAATGNVATEDLVYCLERMSVATGIDLDRTIDTARWLSGELGKPVSSALARAGAFPRPVRLEEGHA
jgi:isopropylmalate/homocitrate/citramalate synthase